MQSCPRGEGLQCAVERRKVSAPGQGGIGAAARPGLGGLGARAGRGRQANAFCFLKFSGKKGLDGS